MKSIKLLLIAIASAIFVWGCEKGPVATQNLISIESFNAIYKGNSKFVLTAQVQDEAAGMISECGFYLSESSSLQKATKKESRLTGSSFSCDVTLENPDVDYYCCAYISNGRTEICSDLLCIKTEALKDSIVSFEAANSFIVSKAGSYRFKTVKGNSSTSVGNVYSAEVLWESFGTSTTPSKGDLINSVSIDDEYIKFSTNQTYKRGNAVIAAKDTSGKILWSWHIWFTEQPQEQTYYNNAGIMMDRNLGATSATPGNIESFGLLYQWGRKDPFIGSVSADKPILAESTITWPSPEESTTETGTIAYCISHPTIFIRRNINNKDWYYSFSESTDNGRWNSSKTIYDPCPAGWKVPDGGKSGVWATAAGTSEDFIFNFNSIYGGMNFSGKFGDSKTIWYPSIIFRSSVYGELAPANHDGGCWSVSNDGILAYDFYFLNDNNVSPCSTFSRALGAPVRCIKE